MEERYSIFTGLILNISRCTQKIKNEEMAVYGLKGKQVQCLFTLYNLDGGASMSELCDRCDEDKGAMSRTVKELCENDLIFVEEKGLQRYKNPIKLTEKGKAFAKVIVDKIDAVLKAASVGVSDSDREILYKSLTRISNNLSKICENYGRKQ